MREHPDRETLKQFISGQLGSEDARLTDRHLATCSECRDRADEVSAQLALQLLDSWLRPSYDEAFERAADGAAKRLAEIWAEGQNTEDLLSDLLREPSSRRRRISTDERFASLKLCELLQSRSREQWSSNPAVALEMADLAVEIARHLDTTRYGSSLVEDARALAWAHLGNSYRVASDLWRAEQALLQAWQHHIRAEEDVYTEAELLRFTASLRRAQGKHEEAIRLVTGAVLLYREGQDPHLEGAALILKGQILSQRGLIQESLSATSAGISRINSIDGDAKLLISGKHNLIFNLALAGAPRKAWHLLQQNRPLYQELGQIDYARLRWLEGYISKDLGRLVDAETALCETREFFVTNQLGTDVTWVLLDLAEVYTRQGRYCQVREVLGELIPLADALGLRSKALAARLLYAQAS